MEGVLNPGSRHPLAHPKVIARAPSPSHPHQFVLTSQHPLGSYRAGVTLRPVYSQVMVPHHPGNWCPPLHKAEEESPSSSFRG